MHIPDYLVIFFIILGFTRSAVVLFVLCSGYPCSLYLPGYDIHSSFLPRPEENREQEEWVCSLGQTQGLVSQ